MLKVLLSRLKPQAAEIIAEEQDSQMASMAWQAMNKNLHNSLSALTKHHGDQRLMLFNLSFMHSILLSIGLIDNLTTHCSPYSFALAL